VVAVAAIAAVVAVAAGAVVAAGAEVAGTDVGAGVGVGAQAPSSNASIVAMPRTEKNELCFIKLASLKRVLTFQANRHTPVITC
jgi:hypothetical protein